MRKAHLLILAAVIVAMPTISKASDPDGMDDSRIHINICAGSGRLVHVSAIDVDGPHPALDVQCQHGAYLVDVR